MDLPTGSWGDAAVGMLKPREESAPDRHGVRTVTFWRHGADGVEKVVQKVKKVTKVVKTSKAVEARRRVPKFGMAAVGTGENITYVAADEVYIEKPDAEAAPILAAAGQGATTCRVCGRSGHWTRMCPFKAQMAAGGELPPETDDDTGPSSSGIGMPGSSSGNVYRPPGAHGASTPDEEHKRTLKVTNLTEDATRDDLRDLFKNFGSIDRINVVKNRETGESRGMAFVCFFHRDDAVKAQAALDGHPYGYQILSVDFAKPRLERGSNAGGRSLSEMHVSGYGKALPQNQLSGSGGAGGAGGGAGRGFGAAGRSGFGSSGMGGRPGSFATRR